MYATFEDFIGAKGFGDAGRLAYNSHTYGTTGHLRQSLLGIVDDDGFVVVHKAFMEYISALTTAAGYAVSESGDIVSKVLSTVRHSRMDPVIYLTGTCAFVEANKAAVMYQQCVTCEVSALVEPRAAGGVVGTAGVGDATAGVPVVVESVGGTDVVDTTVATWGRVEDVTADVSTLDLWSCATPATPSVSSGGRSARRRLHDEFWTERRDTMSKVAGHCYLAMFKPRFVESVSLELASSPRLAAILAYDTSKYDMNAWAGLFVEQQRGNVLHVCKDGTWPLVNVVASFIAGHPSVGPHLKYLVQYVQPGVPVFPGSVTMGLRGELFFLRSDVSALRERNTVIALQSAAVEVDTRRAKPQRLFAKARSSCSAAAVCLFTYHLPKGSPRFVLLKPGVYAAVGTASAVGSVTESTVYYVTSDSFVVHINKETERLHGLGHETTAEEFESKFEIWAFQFEFLPFWARQVVVNSSWPIDQSVSTVVLHTPTVDDLIGDIKTPVVDLHAKEGGRLYRTGGVTASILEPEFKFHPNACVVDANVVGSFSAVYFNTSLKLTKGDKAVLSLRGQESICFVVASVGSEWSTSLEEKKAVPASVVTSIWSKF